MAQNIIINGVTYNGVDSITAPTSGGSEATFVDMTATEVWVFTMDDGTTVEKRVSVG